MQAEISLEPDLTFAQIRRQLRVILMATELTKESLKGVWAGITLSWDERYALDEAAYRENLHRLVQARPHGIYVFGSTGEFHAVDDDEFRRVVDILVEEVAPSGIPTQAGCNDIATHLVIRKLKYAADAGVNGAQLVVPFWMKLTEEEILKFFDDISQAVPHLPLISYNIGRAKWYLYDEYRQIIGVAPNLIGIKWAGTPELDLGRLEQTIPELPELAHFIGEGNLLKAMRFGVQGCYSAWVLAYPEPTIKMFNLAEQGKWAEAEAIHAQVTEVMGFIDEMAEEFGLSGMDPVWDKGAAILSGFLAGHQRTRPPYIGWSDEAMAQMQARMRDRYPDYIFD